MLTLKFYRYFDGETASETTTVTCPRYDVYDRGSDGFEVTVYRSHSAHNNGVFFTVSNNAPDGYSQCYVTNETGKTIDVIKAP